MVSRDSHRLSAFLKSGKMRDPGNEVTSVTVVIGYLWLNIHLFN